MRDTEKKEIFNQKIVASLNNRANMLYCSYCGSETKQGTAQFCAVCHHDLQQDYAPLNALWASYGLEGQTAKADLSAQNQMETQKLFAENRNNASSIAMAFVVYSLVPYLGILFCPGALLFGSVGLAVSYQKPQFGGRQTATYSLLFGLIVLAIQVLLWWLLYVIPELHRYIGD